MFTVIITILFLLVSAYAIFISMHAWRWAKIILLLETIYSEALDVHERTLKTFEKILGMQMFFDSPGVKQVVVEVMDDVKSCKMATQKIAMSLTEHSKRKYIEDVVSN